MNAAFYDIALDLINRPSQANSVCLLVPYRSKVPTKLVLLLGERNVTVVGAYDGSNLETKRLRGKIFEELHVVDVPIYSFIYTMASNNCAPNFKRVVYI